MFITVAKSKIDPCTVTETHLEYEARGWKMALFRLDARNRPAK
jgi:hypothetical protein